MSDAARTHLVVTWRYQTPDDSAPIQAAADDTGRVLVFSEVELADLFAARLREYGLDAESYPVSSTMVAQLLDENGSHDADDVVVVEAQTTGPEDAVRWTAELADRLIATLAADFEKGNP